MQVLPPSPVQFSSRTWWWLAAVPLGCVLLAQVWGMGGIGMMPGRSAVAFLLLGAVLAACAPNRMAWSWCSPVLWLSASLLWQGLGLIFWAIAPEPGFVLWSESDD